MTVNVRIGPFSQLFAPGFGHCWSCRTAWRFVDPHITPYNDRGSGCFPLCEKCWSERTPGERLSFYRLLWERWRDDSGATEDEWEAIVAAVMAGL